MKEIRHIVETCNQIDFTHQKAALAMVARVEGSSYRRTGARMLVLDNGTYLGGVSGGCLEGDALRRAQKAIASNRPSVVTYDTTRDDHHQIGVGLGCNGIIDVLFIPQPVAMIELLRERMYSRTPRLLATITGWEGPDEQEMLGKVIPLESEAQWVNEFPVAEISAQVLKDAQTCLFECRTQTLNYVLDNQQQVRICLEVLVPAVHLVLFGANNDIYPMARVGRELGWDITVVANPLKMDKSLTAMGAKVLHPAGETAPAFDTFTAVILMSHDYKTDFSNFHKLLSTDVRYIGMLGPRKRAQKMFDALAEEGSPVGPADMERIFAPAGLDIGALTPEEISLSIAAEIRACFAGRQGGSLRYRATPIHI